MTFNPNSNCSRCGKKSLLTDEVTGEQFCSKCGYVLSEKVNESGPERKSFQHKVVWIVQELARQHLLQDMIKDYQL